MELAEVFRRHRTGITVALLLVVIEHVAWIVEPTIFGTVIDAFIDRSEDPSIAYLAPLLVWIGVFALNSGAGVLRRAMDDRIYLRAYEDIAVSVASATKAAGHPPAIVAGRTELAREFVWFFQYQLPDIFEQSVDIVGATIALTLYDWRIGLTTMLIVLPLLQITRWYNSRILLLQKDLHDRRETSYAVYATGDPERIRSFVRETSRPQIAISGWSATNFGIVRASLLVIFLVVLHIAIDLAEFSVGDIYAIVAYLWTFVTSSEYLPDVMESWTSLKDISRRVRSGMVEMEGE